MNPAFQKGDMIYVERISIHFRLPHRGDVIAFSVADMPLVEKMEGKDQIWLKRVVGLPGDKIEIHNQTLLVNGKTFAEGVQSARPPNYPLEDGWFTVPEGKYYFLGDNYAASNDSRFCGCVPEASIIGRYLVHYWRNPGK